MSLVIERLELFLYSTGLYFIKSLKYLVLWQFSFVHIAVLLFLQGFSSCGLYVLQIERLLLRSVVCTFLYTEVGGLGPDRVVQCYDGCGW